MNPSVVEALAGKIRPDELERMENIEAVAKAGGENSFAPGRLIRFFLSEVKTKEQLGEVTGCMIGILADPPDDVMLNNPRVYQVTATMFARLSHELVMASIHGQTPEQIAEVGMVFLDMLIEEAETLASK